MGEIISEFITPKKGSASIANTMGLIVAIVAGLGSLVNLVTLINSAGYWVEQISNPNEYTEPINFVFTFILYIAGLLLGVFSVILGLTKKSQFAAIALLIQTVIHPLGMAIIWKESPVQSFQLASESLVGGFDSLGEFIWFVDYLFHPLVVVPAVAVSIITLIKAKPAKTLLVAPSPIFSPEVVNNNSAASTTIPSAPTTKGTTHMSAPYEVMIPGIVDPKVDVATLQVWARAGRIKSNTLVKEVSTGVTFTAAQIPGVFSDKQYTTALILSILLGTIGVDRFYTGHVGIGVGKLLTAGGCGVWALVDIILYATRKVTDSEGNPLS